MEGKNVEMECNLEGTCSDGEPSMPELLKEEGESAKSENGDQHSEAMNDDTAIDNDDLAPIPLLMEIKQEKILEEFTESDEKKRSYSPVVMKQKSKRQWRKDKLLISDTHPEGSDNTDVIKVTCGLLNGLLHKELFYCPGIHRACIELENGSFVTPKKFMFMGEKARLKDWKNAIRWGGHQLRKHIEAGTLQFYRHEELCTGRCVARSPYAGKGELYDKDRLSERARLRKEKFEFETLGFTTETASPNLNGFESEPQVTDFFTTVEENGCMKIQSVSSGDHTLWSSVQNMATQSEPIDVKPDVKQLQLQMMQTMAPVKQETPQVFIAPKPETVVKPAAPVVVPPVSNDFKLRNITETQKPKNLPPSIMNATMPPVSDKDSTDEEDRLLWQGIVELGLIDEFFREIKTALDLLKNTMVKRLVPLEDSNRISLIVRQLGLMQKLKFKLEAHRTDMDRQKRKLDREMMDLQKRVREYEMKKKLLEKRTECFDQILEIPAMKNNPAVSSIPMMQSNVSNQDTVFVSNTQGTMISRNVTQSQMSTGVTATSAVNGAARLATGQGGTILVFPKQSTQFQTSPEGGLKITLKRKQEFSDDESQSTNINSILPSGKSLLLSPVKTENNGANGDMKSEISSVDSGISNLNKEEQNPKALDKHMLDELNSLHDEENASAKAGKEDNLSDEGSVKRSKRKRSVKTYDDFIVDNK